MTARQPFPESSTCSAYSYAEREGDRGQGGRADGGAGAVVERASMAAKLAGQERENHQLLERLANPFTTLSM